MAQKPLFDDEEEIKGNPNPEESEEPEDDGDEDNGDEEEPAVSLDEWVKGIGDSMIRSLSDNSEEAIDAYHKAERAERKKMLEAAGGQKIKIPKKGPGAGAWQALIGSKKKADEKE